MEYKQSAKPLSKYWEVAKKQETSYTGGHVEFIPDSDTLACLRDGNVAFLSMETGEVTGVLVEENAPESAEEIVCFAIHPSGNQIVTASRNQLLRVWDLHEKTMLRTWKAHDLPVATMAFDSTGTLLITGSADHTAKVWDIEKTYCTHNFRHSFGVVHLAVFTKTQNPLYAITCCDDLVIRIWNLYESKEHQLVAELKGHLNSVTNLCVLDNGLLLSSSRDKTVILWDILTGKQLKTSVIYESIESLCVVPPSFYKALGLRDKAKGKGFSAYVLLAGEKGALHLYHLASSQEGSKVQYALTELASSQQDTELVFYKKELSDRSQHNADYYASLLVLKAVLVDAKHLRFVGVTNSNNFKVYAAAEGALRYTHTVIANNDEVVDLCYTTDTNHLAVATNSYELRLFSIPTFSSNLLYGHRDTILSVKATLNGAFLLTTSRDKTVRLWHTASHMCLVTCQGHLQDVSCCSLSQRPRMLAKNLLQMLYADAVKTDCNHAYDPREAAQVAEELLKEETNCEVPAFWVSGSEDKTLKLWEVSAVSKSVIKGAKVTVKAHDKSINAVCVSPNDKLVASCSMDKLIKIWSVPDMALVSTLSGHKKGVWDISFSTLNSVLLSSSGDETLRVWNVKDGSTLYTIEGFDHSLLKCAFLSANLQVVSCDNAGIVKVNNVASKECVTTIDAHDDKIWALATPQDKANQFDTFATGAADGQIKIWRDCTKEREEEELEKKEQLFLQEQEFQKALQGGDYKAALRLALALDKPYNFRLLVEKIMKVETETYEATLGELLQGLSVEDLTKLFGYVREWNLIGRTYIPAQVVLKVLLRVYDSDTLCQVKQMGEVVDALMAYNKRHLERTDRMIQNTYLVEYILQNMHVMESTLKRDGAEEGESKRPKLE